MRLILATLTTSVLLGSVALATSSAQASPTILDSLKASNGQSSMAEKAYWRRRCWRGPRGYVHCRRVWW